MATRLKKDDMVVVIAGRDRGSRGRILRFSKGQDRVFVQGVNIVKKHRKPSQTAPEGGIIEVEASIHASNVMLLDTKTDKPTRVRIKVEKNNEKKRVAARSGATI